MSIRYGLPRLYECETDCDSYAKIRGFIYSGAVLEK